MIYLLVLVIMLVIVDCSGIKYGAVDNDGGNSADVPGMCNWESCHKGIGSTNNLGLIKAAHTQS